MTPDNDLTIPPFSRVTRWKEGEGTTALRGGFPCRLARYGWRRVLSPHGRAAGHLPPAGVIVRDLIAFAALAAGLAALVLFVGALTAALTLAPTP